MIELPETSLATHEEWLRLATEELRSDFQRVAVPLPERLRLSIGFPSTRALSRRRRRIGECWSPARAQDGVPQIFISPLLMDPIEVLAVQVHELVHAAVGVEAGHGAAFRRAALAVGLVGKMTATSAGARLAAKLQEIAGRLGGFPHGGLHAVGRLRQSTRLLKVACPSCGYLVRTTARWIATGLPLRHDDGAERLNDMSEPAAGEARRLYPRDRTQTDATARWLLPTGLRRLGALIRSAQGSEPPDGGGPRDPLPPQPQSPGDP